MKDVYLVSGVRSPFAKAGTDLKAVHAAELGRFALAELMTRVPIPRESLATMIDEVIIGNTGTPSDTANIARVVALNAGLPRSISAYTVHRNCASALESLAQATVKIQAEQGHLYVAGGTESMSQMPLLYNDAMVSFFDRLNRAKTTVDKLKVLSSISIKNILAPRVAIIEGLTDPFCSLNMGQTAELLAREWKISRDEQDQFALRSHRRCVEAQEARRFQDEIAPMAIPPKMDRILTSDSGPRKEQSIEALRKLKPLFDRSYGTVTAGNACPITDGAAMAFVASESGLKKLGVKPLAKIKAFSFAGLEPERMGLGPVYATQRVLKSTGLSLKDMSVVEINEAFAAQVIACQRAFDSETFCQEKFGTPRMGVIDESILNANGGAIAIGHPVGTTGTRIVLTAALELRRRGGQFALATLCIGGGQGGAMLLEAV